MFKAQKVATENRKTTLRGIKNSAMQRLLISHKTYAVPSRRSLSPLRQLQLQLTIRQKMEQHLAEASMLELPACF